MKRIALVLVLVVTCVCAGIGQTVHPNFQNMSQKKFTELMSKKNELVKQEIAKLPETKRQRLKEIGKQIKQYLLADALNKTSDNKVKAKELLTEAREMGIFNQKLTFEENPVHQLKETGTGQYCCYCEDCYEDAVDDALLIVDDHPSQWMYWTCVYMFSWCPTCNGPWFC